MFSGINLRSLLRQSAIVTVGAAILTIAMAWPVVQRPNDLLFGNEIVGRHADAYTVIQGFGERQALGGATQPVVDWVGVWLAKRVGGPAAYNLLILASFPLAALVVFLLARYLGLGLWPAAWASFLFAFSPLHIVHVAYHPHVAQVQWIPLAILAVIAAVDRWSLLRATLILAAVALACLANFYSALILLVVLPSSFWVLKRYPIRGGGGWRKAVWSGVGIAVTAALYVAFFHDAVLRDPAGLAFPAADAQKYAAKPIAYLVPPVDHALLGSMGTRFWQAFDAQAEEPLGDALLEQQVYLGWAVLAMAVLAVAAWRKRPGHSLLKSTPLLVVLALVAFGFSLAPLLSVGIMQVPGPSWPLRALAPMFRAYARFGFVVQLAVFLLAGSLWTLWRQERWLGQRWRRWLIGVLVAVSLVEYLPLPPLRAHPLQPHAGYQLLASKDPGWAALDCILQPQVRASVAPIAAGTIYVADGDSLDCGEPGLARKLASLGVNYLVEERSGSRGGRPGFVLDSYLDDIAVYTVQADAVPIYIRRWAGFSWREGSAESTLRWAGSRASWWLSKPRLLPEPVALEIELVAFPEPRELEVRLNDDLIEVLAVPTEKTWFTLRFTPHRARNRLEFSASGDPVSPDQILGNGDRRRLAFGVGSVRYSRTATSGPASP